MAKIIKLGSTKRYGTRYGRRLKEKVAELEKGYYRKKQKCPYCSYHNVERIAAGIWYCTKCRTKFAGRAYSIKEDVVQEEKIGETPEKEGV